jgi:ectoine hydroxylase-related dioxygenase (phytanoyl-CoA dioxygenase family)
MLIFKNARIGGEVPAHQDSTFIYTNPDSTVGFWYTLQDATEENGCMEFWPGSHSLEISKRMVRSKTKGTEFLYTSKEPEIKDSNFIKYPTKAGTLVVIHGNVYHKTAGNTSDKSRWIYAWHMIEGEYEYPSSNWLQTEQEFTKLSS